MKRLVLRKGFSLQRTPEGAAQLVDARTGDALLLSAADFDALAGAAKGELEPAAGEALRTRFQSFLVESATPAADSFYELDIADAPTVPQIPAVAPITQAVTAVTPRPSAPGRVPSFHELAIPAVGGVMPPAPKRTTGTFPALAPPAQKAPGASGFAPAAPTQTSQSNADAWSVLPVAAASAPPPASPSAPSLPSSAGPDAWSVTQGLAEATLPNVPSPAGPHVAEAVSPMLPSLDELVPAPHPDAHAVVSTPSPAPQVASPAPFPGSSLSPRPSPVPSVAPVSSSLSPRPSPVPSVAPVASSLSPRPSPVPSVAPVASSLSPRPSPVPSVAPVASSLSPVPSVPAVAPVSNEGGGLDSGIFKDLPPDLAPPATKEPEVDVSLDSGIFKTPPPPEKGPVTAEQELRDALAAAAQQPVPATMPDDEPLPTAELLPLDEDEAEPIAGEPLDVTQPVVPAVPAPAGPEQFRSQEDNLRAAMEQTEAPPQSRDEVQALLSNTAKTLDAPASPAAPPPPTGAEPLPSSKKPMVLTFVGVMLLAAGVAASFMLRPGGGADGKPVEPPRPTPTTAADAGAAPVARAVVDAGSAPVATAPVDEGTAPVATAPVDAGAAAIATAPVDAGAPVAKAPVDAGAAPAAIAVVETPPGDEGVVGEVVGRGRVKMGEVTAAADGTVTWSVEDQQRVKSKQALGSIAKADGSTVALTSPQVGLAMFKQANGAAVTKGAVLAEIIYFEAWAKAQVKGAVPTPAWRCEVISESTAQKAPCKISVVTPKGAGAQVTVAIEPRWFDQATDAKLKLAPP